MPSRLLRRGACSCNVFGVHKCFLHVATWTKFRKNLQSMLRLYAYLYVTSIHYYISMPSMLHNMCNCVMHQGPTCCFTSQLSCHTHEGVSDRLAHGPKCFQWGQLLVLGGFRKQPRPGKQSFTGKSSPFFVSEPPILRQKGCDNALRGSSRLFEQLFELFSVVCLFSSKLFELIRVVVIFVVVILVGPIVAQDGDWIPNENGGDSNLEAASKK